ncbi:MAG TPA: GspH/FimT family pseudopilin [Spirochaetia bacterium]|nr:GspH/FimT family pseudopilin [Spirochaetia bacterium]
MGARLQPGFSLVEVMMVVVIVGILIALGIPSFTAWVQNTQIRTAAESLINGLQTAKNEAIRRNSCMQIQFSNKTAWTVNPCSDPLAVPPYAQRAAEEGSVNADAGRVPSTSDTVSFNALGRVVNPNPSDGTPPVTQMDICNPSMTGAQAPQMRQLRIEIPPGGSIRMCDPNPSIAATDPRSCSATSGGQAFQTCP